MKSVRWADIMDDIDQEANVSVHSTTTQAERVPVRPRRTLRTVIGRRKQHIGTGPVEKNTVTNTPSVHKPTDD